MFAPPVEMSAKNPFSRLKLRHLLFLLLLFSGIIPVVTSNIVTLGRNRVLLEDQERLSLTERAESLSREINSDLVGNRTRLEQLGNGLLALPVEGGLDGYLTQPWIGSYLRGFLEKDKDVLVGLRLLDAHDKQGGFIPANVGDSVLTALDAAYEDVLAEEDAVFRFAVLPDGAPVVVYTTAMTRSEDGFQLILQSVARLKLLDDVFRREQTGKGQLVQAFLTDRAGKLLWSAGADAGTEAAVQDSELVRDFVQLRQPLTAEYELTEGDKKQLMLGMVSPIPVTGWGLVVHKPKSAAFQAAQQMLLGAVVSSLLLIALALVIAAVAARQISHPIQRLAETSHEIAEGNFDNRVDLQGLSFEFADLARDFNRMSGHVERYVQRLREAAQQNRELFIGSVRAFAAAIDAKDPYTRGHSERVAAYSRLVARHLGLPEDEQQIIWLSGLLHDVGKIGIEDRILKKGGVLTDEEYAIMKTHPVVGAEIIAPVEQLKEMIPGVRWHHESWNGRGYPDGKKADAIPLIARIIGVADTFDAITTNRPYQKAYTFQYAVETITKLTGTKFDAKVTTAFLSAYESGDIDRAAKKTVKETQSEHVSVAVNT